jgi:hypothetical protein
VFKRFPAAKCLPANAKRWASSLFAGNRLDVPCGPKTRKDQKTSDLGEFRLALKVLLSNVRTDTESGGKADERQQTYVACQPSPQE